MTRASCIEQIAIMARRFLVPQWRKWHAEWGPPAPASLSQWTCVRSSAFLCAVLTDAEIPARLQSGVPHPARAGRDGLGFRTGDAWHSHAWAGCDGLIVDITNDQFGGAEIIVTADWDKRYRAGTDEKTMLTLSPRGALVLERLLVEWRAAPSA